MKKINDKIQSVKADLILINEITKPSKISQIQAPSNMQELHNLLKFKNTRSDRSKLQKQNARNWLNKEGIDIAPLVERVKKVKQVTEHKQELKKIEQDCIFYIPDMNHRKIDDYLIKAHDYASMSVIQKSMKRSNLSKIIKERVNSKFAQNTGLQKVKFKQHPMSTVSKIQTQTRDDQKREKYLKCISQFGERLIKREELTNYICSTVGKKFWRIFGKHVKCLNEYRLASQEQKMTLLYLNSLKQVQDEYDSYLATGTESLNYYLTSNYLQRLDRDNKPYIRDREHKSFWGKAFILYRAGRKKDFYNLLSSRNETQLMSDFNRIDHSIQQKEPIKFQGKNYSEINDVFRKQLIYTLKGQAKFQFGMLQDYTSLDFIWILLRNLAIFKGRSREVFEERRNSMLQKYSIQRYLSEQMLYNYFYVMSYDQIAQMGPSEIMDRDDYVHFLICLNENLGLVQNNQQKIRKLLTKQLLFYTRQLINSHRPQYVYYLGLIPREDRVSQISNLLSSSNLIANFNWQFLRSCIPTKQQFEQIVKTTLQKHLLNTNNYMTAAQKYIQLLNDEQQAVKCLLQFLIKSFYNNSFTDHTALDAESACDQYISRNPQYEAKYKTVLSFLIECRRLIELLRDRKDADIYDLVSKSEFIMLGSSLTRKHEQFLQNLKQLSSFGLSVYFRYLKNIIKGLEIYCLRQNKNEQLFKFITLLEENLEFILSQQNYRSQQFKEETIELMKFISSTQYDIGNY